MLPNQVLCRDLQCLTKAPLPIPPVRREWVGLIWIMQCLFTATGREGPSVKEPSLKLSDVLKLIVSEVVSEVFVPPVNERTWYCLTQSWFYIRQVGEFATKNANLFTSYPQRVLTRSVACSPVCSKPKYRLLIAIDVNISQALNTVLYI